MLGQAKQTNVVPREGVGLGYLKDSQRPVFLEQNELVARTAEVRGEQWRWVGTSYPDALTCLGALTLAMSDIEPKSGQMRQLYKVPVLP